jgi:hypothetical protein
MHGKQDSVWRMIKMDMTVRASLIFSLLLMVVQFVLLLIYWTRIPPEIPLFYSLPSGAARLAHKNNLLLLPLMSALTWFSNFFLIKLTNTALSVYRRLIVWFISVTIVLLLIATVLLLLLVF